MKEIKQKLMIDIGCGGRCQPGFIGMDKMKFKGVKIIHDAEVFPWPFENDSCSCLIMSHFIEHVKPWLTIDLLNEAWRVLESDGVLMVSTPYGGSFRYIQDPTHCNPWNEATPLYFIKGTEEFKFYNPKPWKLDRLFYNPVGDLEFAIRALKE